MNKKKVNSLKSSEKNFAIYAEKMEKLSQFWENYLLGKKSEDTFNNQ